MKRRTAWKILLAGIWGIGLFLNSLLAQSLLVHKYTVENGLPTAVVNGIAQDSTGRMWFATRMSLSVYDGLQWEHFEIVKDFKGPDYFAVACDDSGRIWTMARYPRVRIFFYEGGTWHPLPEPPVGFEARYFLNGFAVTRVEGRTAVAFSVDNIGVFIWYNGRWHTFSQQQGLLSNEIKSIAAYQGRIYVATRAGLSVIENGRVNNSWNEPVNGVALMGIAVEPSPQTGTPRLWLHGKDWLGILEGGTLTHLAPGLSVPSLKWVILCPDGRGGVYYGDSDSLAYFRPGLSEPLPLGKRNGLLANGVNDIFVDREHNTWLATVNGICKIPSLRFRNYTEQHGLLENNVTAIIEQAPGQLVFGHSNGLTFFDGRVFQKHAFSRRNSQIRFTRISDFSKDNRGNIWAAASAMGLLKITPDHRIERYQVPSGIISTVLVDREQRIWLYTVGGIYRFHRGKFVPIENNALKRKYVRKIFQGKDGTLYFATDSDGLYTLKNNRWKHYPALDQELGNNVFTVYEDTPRKRLLVGTMGGLYTVARDSLRKLTDASPIIDRPVYFIIRGPQGRLWFGTDNGVFRWDGGVPVKFGIREGLAGPETSQSAALVDHSGKLWIGTTQGLTCYDRRFDREDIPPPIMELRYVEVNGTRHPPNRPLRLDADENTLVFRFQALSFIDEASVIYEYKLEGFDPDFEQADQSYQGKIRYINLPPGNYVFHIRARNALGQWSSLMSTATIRILQPFWKSWWFISLSLLSFALFAFYVKLRRDKERYFRQLQLEFEEKTVLLQQSEEKFRKLFEETKDGVYISTPQGRILDANPAAVELLGFASKEQLLQVNINELLFPDPKERQAVQRLLDNVGFLKNVELTLKRGEDQSIHVLATITAEKDAQNKSVLYRGFLHDITEKRKLEKRLFLAQKMESIGLLAGGIAHDFNNILSSILGYASFLKMDLSPEETHYKYVDIIEKSATRAAELTSQLLGFARGGKYEVRPVNLNSVVKETLSIVVRTFDKAIEIKTNLDENLPTVEADPSQIQQVVLNLCVNARDAMPRGGTLTISTSQVTLTPEQIPSPKVTHTDRFVLLTVSDTGVGIPDKVKEKIFDPFFTTKEKGKGTGLGLSMVYGVVKNHGGFIELDSVVNRGTTFRIYLPASELPEAKSVEQPPRMTAGQGTVLVVDDEEAVRGFLQDVLQRAGYKVLTAADGEEALEVFAEHEEEIDLIILDMIMPKKGGEETLKELRERNTTVRVLIATGYVQKVPQGLSELGVEGILQKPFKVKELLHRIYEILSGYTAEESKPQKN